MSVLLTCRDVCDTLQISRQAVYRKLRTDPAFPRPIHVGASSPRWKRDELENWVESLSESRTAA